MVFELSVEHVSFEVLLFVVFDQINSIVDNLFLLPELTRMNYHQILTEIQFAHILTQTAIHSQSQR